MHHAIFNKAVKNSRALKIDGSGSIKHAPFDRAVYFLTRRFSWIFSARLNEHNEVVPNGKRRLILKFNARG